MDKPCTFCVHKDICKYSDVCEIFIEEVEKGIKAIQKEFPDFPLQFEILGKCTRKEKRDEEVVYPGYINFCNTYVINNALQDQNFGNRINSLASAQCCCNTAMADTSFLHQERLKCF